MILVEMCNNVYSVFTYYSISGFRSSWWINSFSNVLWIYVVSTLVNVLHIRTHCASKCFECLPGPKNENFIPHICGK